MTRAYVGIGSNLGDRAHHVAFGLKALAALQNTVLLKQSRVYESPPVGPDGQGPYLNAVVELDTRLSARACLDALLEIENRAGRVRRERWGPRTLDLDLLLYGDERVEERGLQVPHPRLLERSFVLRPLAELAPEHRIDGKSVEEWARQRGDSPSIWIWEGKLPDLIDRK